MKPWVAMPFLDYILPIMVCCWLPEGGLDSSLHVFFDETADRNLDIGSVFTLGAGLAQMFTKELSGNNLDNVVRNSGHAEVSKHGRGVHPSNPRGERLRGRLPRLFVDSF